MAVLPVNQMIDKPNLLASAQQGYAFGTQMRQQREEGERRNKLAGIAQQAYNAPVSEQNALVGQAVGVDPTQGFQLADSLSRSQLNASKAEDDRAQKLRGAAKYMLQAIESKNPAQIQGAHRTVAQFMSGFGQQFPEQFDEATMLPKIQEVLAQTAYLDEGGGGDLKSLRVGADGNYYAIQGGRLVNTGVKADPNVAILEGSGGFYGVDKRNMTAAPVNLGAGGMPPSESAPAAAGTQAPGQAAATPSGRLDPVADFASLAQQHGAQVSSLRRTPTRNQEVGGVPNSYHNSGEAGDFVVPQDRRAAFIADARARGYEAIDEGDHVHVEPPRRGATVSQFGSGQQLQAPAKTAAQSEIERRLQLAREMGASADEQRQLVLGRDAAAAGAKPLPVGALKLIQEEENAANGAAAINTSIQKHLSRIGSGQLEFGPVDNLLNRGRNFVGASTQESRNYQEFVSDLERLRNDSLRLNAGVQTDGDAQRAWNELFANLNDGQYVQQRLQTIASLNERAERLRRANVDAIQKNYGRNDDAPGARQPVEQAPRRLKFNPATGRLE